MLAHTTYMRRCIELAQLGAGKVSPNPMVGAVIVHNNQIIGEGFHQSYGEAHAEVNAITNALSKFENAESMLKSSVIYVTLEPCAHFGKTPPCADLIIRYGIPEVVIGSTDPFLQVNGLGIKKLQEAGVKVTLGICKEECDYLNRRFFTRVTSHRPYIILKWAQTANLFFAPSDNSQKWISSYPSKLLTHQWRTEEDAVLVGKNTALIDNPRLNVREAEGRDPIRIIIDRRLELPGNLHLFDQSQPTIVFNEMKSEIDGNIKYLEVEDFDLLSQFICYQLYLMDIQSVIIEGGAETLKLFIQNKLWDEARIFTSPVLWENGIKSPEIFGKTLIEEKVGSDVLRIIGPIH